MTAPVIVWFRRDLRLADNPALAAATRSGAPVVPLYVLDETAGVRRPGAAGLWWLDKSLRVLADALVRRGSRLILRRGEAAKVVQALAIETGAAAVFSNRLYDPGAVERDAGLEASLRDVGVEASSSEAGLLLDPRAVKTKAAEPYRVFTPFWRAARMMVDATETHVAPDRLAAPRLWPSSERIEDWALHPRAPDWSSGFGDWRPGEAGAEAALDRFIESGLGDYRQARDRPDKEGSSRLSPHLHWGEITPQRIWRRVASAVERGQASDAQAEKLYAELGWREFNHQLLFHQPELGQVSFKRAFDRLPWRRAPAELTAWKRGRTGYPIVDAGMRQLWATGWMHNRVRLITSSFLVKHLLIDWREGERWFWDTLVDADEANNVGNWQWVAGSGADASPFFRIFNPVTQGEKFDPDGVYVRRWAPELAKMSPPYIHAPWTAPEEILWRAGVKLGRDYPRPIVDHGAARERALEALRATRAEAEPED